MSFHTQYRPKGFDKVVGNKQTIKSLKSLFKGDKCFTHTFLFYGASGCGKTTFARIIASKLKCSTHDYIEINAGNNRGIDTAREVLRRVPYAPIKGDNKVILIDEVHQATKDFQNALLKVLEDTPEHVYFILCTTQPQKLLLTVRNRCTSYEVEPLTDKQMMILLERICQNQFDASVNIDKKVKRKITDKAEGCPRQALILLEQVIYLDKKDMLKAIKLFKTQEQKVIDLCRAILKKEGWGKVSKILKGIEEEPESVRRAVLGYMNAVALNKDSAHCMLVYMAFKEPFYDVGKAGLTFACYKALKY